MINLSSCQYSPFIPPCHLENTIFVLRMTNYLMVLHVSARCFHFPDPSGLNLLCIRLG